MVISFKFFEYAKADPPIETIPSGIVTHSKFEHSKTNSME